MKSRLWLCVPPIALCMVDQLLTLWGQSEHYWQGRYKLANEASPPFHWLLTKHPLAFEAGIAGWIVLFTVAIVLLPRRLAMTLSIAIVIGHTWGAASWLTIRAPHGYWLSIALFGASALLITMTCERFSRGN